MQYRYIFGEGSDAKYITAPSVDSAIKIFKIEILFPEKYVSKDCIKKNDKGYQVSEYNSDLGRNIAEYATTPYIPVSLRDDSSRDYKVEFLQNLPLSECVDVTYSSLLAQKMLSGPVATSTDIQQNSQIQVSNKMEARQMHDDILIKQAELEVMKRKLQKQMHALQKDLAAKVRTIYAIETYMGMHEEIHVLRSGENAHEEMPLYIYQQKLYMDEEVGIFEDEGLDFTNLEEFDDWIIKHWRQFLYKKKSICAWQIRRTKKNYSDNAYENAMINDNNWKTYFLIRNGDNLYRIFSDVRTPDTLFPVQNEMSKVYEEAQKWSSDENYVTEKVTSAIRPYLFSFIALQGIIDRTEILGTSLKGNANLLVPDGFTEDQIVLIRDAEKGNLIGDSRPKWRDFLNTNRETIHLGSRILITIRSWYDIGHRDGWRDRTEPRRPGNPPCKDEIYTILEDTGTSGYYTPQYKIAYMPSADVYDEDSWEVRQRKQKVGFRLHRDELLNIDAVTLDDIQYYLTNRLYRRDYLDLIPMLKYARQVKKEEYDLETPFAKLVISQAGLPFDEESDLLVRKAIVWWKLKNKWKRAITTDESKALRMVLKKTQELLDEED